MTKPPAPNALPQDLVDAIVKLWNHGHSSTTIGKRFNRSRNSIIGIVHRARDKGVHVVAYVVNPGKSPKRRHNKRRQPAKPKTADLGPLPPSLPQATPVAPGLEIAASERPTRSRFGSYAITNLPPGGCRYSGSTRRPLLFCGRPGYPWCPEHRELVYVKR